MRKYLMSGAVIGAVLGIKGMVAQTRKGPRDWRLALLWLSWGIGVAIAVGTVAKDAADRRDEVAAKRHKAAARTTQ